MSPRKTKGKAPGLGKKIHKRLNHVPSHLFQNGFDSRFPSLNNPVANRPNIQEPQATRQITDGEAPPRSIASSELYALPKFPVDMEIRVPAARRGRKSFSTRYHPRGFSRQRPLNLGSNDCTFAPSGNMTPQVAGPSSQSSATQVQYISGSHLPQQRYNPLGFSCSQMDYHSSDPHAGAQQPWISTPATSIYPPSMANFQIPDTQWAAAQNQTIVGTPYPYSDLPLYFSDDNVSMASDGPSIATPSLQCSIPVQQATPDSLPANVDHFGSFFN